MWAAAPVFAVQTWSDHSPATSDPVSDFVQDPSNRQHLFAQTGFGAFGTQLFETWDGGIAWQSVPMPVANSRREKVQVSSDGAVYLYLGTDDTPTQGVAYLYKRDSNGSWVSIGPQTNFPRAHFAAEFAVASGDRDFLALWIAEEMDPTYGRNSYLYLSSDQGTTWSAPGSIIADPTTLAILEPSSGPRLVFSGSFYPSTGTEAFYWATSGWDLNWQTLRHGEPGYEAYLATSRRNPASMYYSRLYNLEVNWAASPMMRSEDGGASFVSFGPDGFYSGLVQGNIHPDLLVRHAGFVSGLGPQISWDGGAQWTSIAEVPGTTFRPASFALSTDESLLYAFGTMGLKSWPLLGKPGIAECSGQINGSGQAAKVSAHGSASLAQNDLKLWVRDVTPLQFGMLLTSQSPGFVAHPGGSFGDLCLGGAIGRYNQTALWSGSQGELFLDVDWDLMPTPMGPSMAQVGQTWRFQSWFRDSISGTSGSNFSNATAVMVLP